MKPGVVLGGHPFRPVVDRLGIYGMNFDHMPETPTGGSATRWRWALMLALALILYMVFKRRRWL